MRKTVLVFALASAMAAGAMWLSVRAGILSNLARDPLAGPPCNPMLSCGGPNPDSGEVVNEGSSAAWGMWLLAPLPFVVVGLVGYKLYRSRPKQSWKDGSDEWDYQ